jgi:hypothetical protein
MMKSGTKLYIANRRLNDLFLGKEKTISDAIRQGVAAWGIEDEILLQIRVEGVELVGVLCRENGDLWLTTLDTYFDPERHTQRSFGTSAQRCVLLKCFRRRSGRIRL